ncbi:hypothetical protein ST37_12410 [Vibrio sp. qd031]|uniref:exodeoxyribonuclease V subunit gamma n=1 Tax=Vibrio sp. qd031 TaxID=1603038 RepID=UPI000A0FC908|nr:exodeoxyribonuclease V subunit gamma [Vibrio sp. qd031]ORT49237.1 hypothetical protein ST37_12410 [Vibrio sp. qd031]
MFTVYHSNQIDLLNSLMIELIRNDPLPNPLQAEVILVQSPGMSQWLKLSIAQQQGVAGNIEFPLPATFIWQLFEKVLPDVPSKSAFNKESMTWRLNAILPNYLDTEEFAPLSRYLNDADPLKQLQLAEKIADTFDGYLVYRPDWIAAWEGHQEVEEVPAEQSWQPILWRALFDHTVASGASPYHRANLYDDFIDTLAHYQGRIEGLPSRLFVFGISSLPPRYLEALHAIGQHIDVHFMFANPCRYYWGDVRDQKTIAKMAAQTRKHIQWQGDHSVVGNEAHVLKGSEAQNIEDPTQQAQVGNALLASMGKLGCDNLLLLSQLECQEIEAFVDHDLNAATLLQRIQSDILELDQRDISDDDSIRPKHIVADSDRSLTLHQCHSPTREVEVLHDQLLHLFDSDPSLTPRDVIVMVPDINRYTPAIEAIFGQANDERRIPYSISDRTTTEANPLLNAFFSLLDLPNSRAQSSLMLELLETPAVLRRFELSVQEFERIKLWVEEVGIRWGLTEKTAAELGFEAPLNTWQFGLQRMLMGYSLHPDVGLYEQDDRVISPFNHIQGMDADVAGRLAQYIDNLIEFQQRFAQSHSIEAWMDIINQLLSQFFTPELDEELMVSAIRDALVSLKQPLSELDDAPQLDIDLIRYCLKQKLDQSRVSQRFLAGQVNFCTLMPMRSIPFKVVCLLGMNDGAYPPAEMVEGFDLMQNKSRPGDRSRRIDGRYMFLEALLSAQHTLYISYVARSIRDNSVSEPSILVSELLEYCEQNYSVQLDIQADDNTNMGADNELTDFITYSHSMTPYSRHAFDSDTPSYAREWLPVAQANSGNDASHTEVKPLAEDQWQLPSFTDEIDGELIVELDVLSRFWTLPVKRYMNQRLGVYFDPFDIKIEDDEPFAMGGLGSYLLRQQLLEHSLEQSIQAGEVVTDPQSYLKHKRAEGVLPVGAFGELDIVSSEQQIAMLLERILPYCSRPQPARSIDLHLSPLSDTRSVFLQGWLDNQYEQGMVRYRCGQLSAKYVLGFWIDHLAAMATGEQRSTQLFGLAKQNVVEWTLLPLTSENAKHHLETLIQLYVEGLDLPLPFFVDTAWEGALVIEKAGLVLDNPPADSDDGLKAMAKMQQTFEGNSFRPGESDNPYIQRVWPQWNDQVAEKCYQLMLAVMLPLLSHCEREK